MYRMKIIILIFFCVALIELHLPPVYAAGHTSACLFLPDDSKETMIPVYSKPNVQSKKLGDFYNGTDVSVAAFDKNGWAQISIGDPHALVIGYVKTTQLAMDDEMLSIKGALPIGFMSGCKQLYSTHDATMNQLDTIVTFPANTLVIVLGHHEGQYFINTGTAYGWIPMNQITLDDSYHRVRSFLDIPSMGSAYWEREQVTSHSKNNASRIPVEIISDMGEMIQIRLNSHIFFCPEDQLVIEEE